jgi:hypothetical protein
MDLRLEARNEIAGKWQQQFNLPTDWVSHQLSHELEVGQGWWLESWVA